MNYGLVPFQCLETANIRPKIADLFEMPASYLDVTAGKLDPARALVKIPCEVTSQHLDTHRTEPSSDHIVGTDGQQSAPKAAALIGIDKVERIYFTTSRETVLACWSERRESNDA